MWVAFFVEYLTAEPRWNQPEMIPSRPLVSLVVSFSDITYVTLHSSYTGGIISGVTSSARTAPGL